MNPYALSLLARALFSSMLCLIPLIGCAKYTWELAKVEPRFAYTDIRQVAILDFRPYVGYPTAAITLSNVITQELVQAGYYQVAERTRIENVLREQRLGQTGLIDPSTAAAIGRLVGVDAVIYGDVISVNCTGQQEPLQIPGLQGFRVVNSCEASVDYRFVDTRSGLIRWSDRVLGSTIWEWYRELRYATREAAVLVAVGGFNTVPKAASELAQMALEEAARRIAGGLGPHTELVRVRVK